MGVRTAGLAAVLVAVLLVAGSAGLAPPAHAQARAAWKVSLDEVTAGKDVGVSVRLHGQPLYAKGAYQRRVPASNAKLLLTMALYNRVRPDSTITTTAAARTMTNGTVDGNLWIIGRGDPSVTGAGQFGKRLPFRPAHLALLARRISDNGVRRITGRVKGAVAYFKHDWWAHGWEATFPSTYAPLASGLSFQGNNDGERNIGDPEVRAARYVTRRLRALGVHVANEAGAGSLPSGTRRIAAIRSAPLRDMVTFTNRRSSNFFAEMLGKRLSVAAGTRPGTIAGGAREVQRWAAARDVAVTAYDASGLSYDNRVSPAGMTALLEHTAGGPTFTDVRVSLPRGGQGTLEDRLTDVLLRAKTGTLSGKSALSGWVWLERRRAWASFSILSQGTTKDQAVRMENRIVRVLAERAS